MRRLLDPMILSTAYFPPIQYVALLCKRQRVHIELWEHFVKQTYRNRMRILSANGPLDLIVPLEKAQGCKTLLKDVRVSYNDRWNAEHWNAICSAYNSSPYFEYYADDLHRFFTEKFKFLWEYNTEILTCILKLMHITCDISYTSEFTPLQSQEEDYRYTISPKIPTNEITFPEYTQVFEDKYSFMPNLSILDLLCAMGPESKTYLTSIRFTS